MPSPEGSTVTFRRAQSGVSRLALVRFARRLQKEVSGGRPFDCLVTTDTELRRLNAEYRGKDEATDVLSFPAAEHGGILGDIAISARKAREQARRFGHDPETEMRVLMLHGVLHLLGMDHDADSGRMARAEKRWRARLQLPVGLIERAQS